MEPFTGLNSCASTVRFPLSIRPVSTAACRRLTKASSAISKVPSQSSSSGGPHGRALGARTEHQRQGGGRERSRRTRGEAHVAQTGEVEQVDGGARMQEFGHVGEAGADAKVERRGSEAGCAGHRLVAGRGAHAANPSSKVLAHTAPERRGNVADANDGFSGELSVCCRRGLDEHQTAARHQTAVVPSATIRSTR